MLISPIQRRCHLLWMKSRVTSKSTNLLSKATTGDAKINVYTCFFIWLGLLHQEVILTHHTWPTWAHAPFCQFSKWCHFQPINPKIRKLFLDLMSAFWTRLFIWYYIWTECQPSEHGHCIDITALEIKRKTLRWNILREEQKDYILEATASLTILIPHKKIFLILGWV